MTCKNNSIKEIVDIINNSKNIAIAGHINPDLDAIGSSIALGTSLKKINKNVKVLLDDYNEKYNILPNIDLIYKEDTKNLNIDLFICMDCGSKERLGKNLNLFTNCKNSIVIDHHISNNYYGKYNYVNCFASSTSELAYEIISEIGNIDKDIATCIYAGILVDTGGFRHKTTSSKTMLIISHLMKLGIDFSYIYNKIMKIKNLKEINILKLVLNKLVIVKDINVCYVCITIEDRNKLNIDNKDLNGISEITLNIENIEVGIFLYEKSKNEVKVSMRSLNFNVNKFASYFGGGGHINAAGFIIKKPLEKTIEIILNKLRKEL